jgi:hypothetical protein
MLYGILKNMKAKNSRVVKIFKNKNFFYFLLFIPIPINFLKNYFSIQLLKAFSTYNYFDFISSLLLFLLLYNFGILIKTNLNLPFISTGIVIYILSYFILDNLILFFYDGLKSRSLFFLVNIGWLIYISFLGFKKLYLFKIFISYTSLNLFNNQFISKLSKNKNIIGDVKDIHFEHVSNIYENSYLFSMNNSSLEGYPQLTSYFQAVLSRVSIFMDEFQHISSSTYVMYFLLILLIFELDISTVSKFYLSCIFTALIFNSGWLKFIFVESLMTEGVLNYLFCTLILSSLKCLDSSIYNGQIIFFNLGLLYLGKQFISLLSLFAVIIFLLITKNKFYALYGFSGLILKQLSYRIHFKNLTVNYHLEEVDLKDTFFDLLLLRNIKLENINIILKNLYLDKPTTLVFFLFFFLSGVYLFKIGFKNKEINILIVMVILNFLLVFVLYISIWQNMELESPIRYMLNLLVLVIITEFKIIDSVTKS